MQYACTCIVNVGTNLLLLFVPADQDIVNNDTIVQVRHRSCGNFFFNIGDM